MTSRSIPERAELWAVIVTYRRPQVLEAMLAVVRGQTMQPDHLVVVDNDQDERVAELAGRVGATYLDAGGNIGPAGGVALAMRHVIDRAGPDDWLLCLDDDDLPWRDDLIEEMWRFAHQQARVDPATGGVGGVGGFYRRELGIFRRPEDEELVGAVAVDVLAGGRLPFYRCKAIREVGTFDPQLFWGFEEGEYGLRLRKAGRTLFVNGSVALDWRRTVGELDRSSASVKSASNKAAWRRYYGVRNAVVVARRYGKFWTPALVAAGGTIRGVRGLAAMRRPLREVLLPVRGAVDGLFCRLGRTVDPGGNRKTA